MTPKDKIQQVKSLVPIGEWLDFLGVEKASRDNYFCPFHEEKNPSFNVWREGNKVKDFHDNTMYDHLDVAFKLKGWVFPVALEELMRFAGMNPGNGSRSASLKKGVTEKNPPFLPTAEQKRETMLEESRIFFNSDKKKILSMFRKNKPYDIPEELFDRLRYFPLVGYHPQRGRLVVEWKDTTGRVIGLAGRALAGEMPKYKLSGVLLKDKMEKTSLFGADIARGAEKLLVVEGIWDALIGQIKSKEVVALGGSLPPKPELFDEFPNLKAVVFAPDNDAAGKSSFIKRVLEVTEELRLKGIEVYAVRLETDLDESIMVDGKSVKEIFDSATSIKDFLRSLSLESETAKSVSDGIVAVRAREAIAGLHPVARMISEGEDEAKILEEISKMSLSSEKEKFINMFAKARKLPKPVIKKDLARFARNLKIHAVDTVNILHPTYHVSGECVSLGFSVQAVINGSIETQRTFITRMNGKYHLSCEDSFEKDDKKYFFDPSKACPPINSSWNKEDLLDFYSQPKAVPLPVVYEKIKAVLRSHVEFEDDILYSIIGLYIILTYFHRCFPVVPFLFIFGPKGSGKSQLLDCLSLLCFNAVKIKGITLSALGDTIDYYRATLIIDQAETLSLPQNSEIIGMIADSYSIYGGKRRIVNINNKDKREVVEFETFSPKIFASISEIDEDIRDRCLIIQMNRATRKCARPNPARQEWKMIKSALYRNVLAWAPQFYRDYIARHEQATEFVSSRIEEFFLIFGFLCDKIGIQQEEREKMFSYLKKNADLTQFEISGDEKTLFEALMDQFGLILDELKITDDRILSLIKEKTLRPRTARWVMSKLKQYDLIEGIEKDMDGEGKGRKRFIVTQNRVKKQYEKYFFTGSSVRPSGETKTV